MRKTILINGIECHFKSSAAVPRMYRLKFGRDIFVDMTKLKKQIDNLISVAIMSLESEEISRARKYFEDLNKKL